MHQFQNAAALAKVVAADAQGQDKVQMLPLYVELNTYGVTLDTPIHRIVEIDRLLADIRDSRLSHTVIGPVVWGDPNENPLLRVRYKDPVTGGDIGMESMASDLYGVCWSLSSTPASGMWDYFSHGKPAVRLQTTVGKILEAAMDPGNPFYMLQHYVGEMSYLEKAVFDAYFQDQDYTKHLDSLGQGLARSTMSLPTDYASEEEVRLIFMALRDQPWNLYNVRFSESFASVPFKWGQRHRPGCP